MNSTMIVGKVEIQKDRVLIYSQEQAESKHYYVIATKEQGEKLKAGDRIDYQPYGINFGWFIQST